jgi:hypothetical protein
LNEIPLQATAEIQAFEDEIFEWIEDKAFTEGIKKYFDKNSLMFR